MSNNPPEFDYEAIRRRAEKRVKARQEFWEHLTIYIAVNTLLWGIYVVSLFATQEIHFPWPIFPMMGWGLGLFFHALDVFWTNSRHREINHELMIEREIQKEMELLGLSRDEVIRKRKNDDLSADPFGRESVMHLSDDGELITDNESRSARRKQR
jgi:hypothetical protein